MTNSLALIIEDEYDVSIIFAQALRAAGFETEIVRSGDTALTQLTCMTPDVVVLDLHLPRVPGTQILEQIRADPRLSSTRVIVATAHPQLAESVKGQTDWVLNKPVSFGQLRDLATQLTGGCEKAGHVNHSDNGDMA
jgi:DNA-binding response OmpR family regulator